MKVQPETRAEIYLLMETLLLRMKGAYLYRIIYVLYMLLDVMSAEAMSLTSVVFGNGVYLDK